MDASQRISWPSYQGQTILRVDYRHLVDTQDLLSLLDEQQRLEETCAGATLVCADFRHVRLSPDFIARAKNIGRGRRRLVARTAIICFSALHNILLEEYIFATGDTAVRGFADEQTALSWLVSQEPGRAAGR